MLPVFILSPYSLVIAFQNTFGVIFQIFYTEAYILSQLLLGSVWVKLCNPQIHVSSKLNVTVFAKRVLQM